MSELQTMPLRFRVWDKEGKRFFILDDLMPGLEEPAKSDTRFGLSELCELQKQFGKVKITSTRFDISQDTGFKDGYQYPIFTGDILQDDDEGYLSIVQYRGGEIVTVSLDGEQVIESLSAVALYSTVIGNIWSKPDLWEGDK